MMESIHTDRDGKEQMMFSPNQSQNLAFGSEISARHLHTPSNRLSVANESAKNIRRGGSRSALKEPAGSAQSASAKGSKQNKFSESVLNQKKKSAAVGTGVRIAGVYRVPNASSAVY